MSSQLPMKKLKSLAGWGGFPRADCQALRPERHRHLKPALGPQIARGAGRSYGDAALCSSGTVILIERLNRFLSFDASSGVVTAEAGVTLADILETMVPRGWFLPVTPGTSFCTLGGCFAADVHGKNHHVDGCFSQHVHALKLITADGVERNLTQDDPLFWATAGGMGLTGLISEMSLQMIPIETSWMQVQHRAARNLDHVLDMFIDPNIDSPYSVAWIDCLAKGDKLGRSVLMTGRHAARTELPVRITDPLTIGRAGRLAVPFQLPSALLNGFTVRTFNSAYFAMQSRKSHFLSHYRSFFYPLDGIRNWNRIYGKRGFIQHQVVLPMDGARAGLREMLTRISSKGYGSFLAVLKKFGSQGPGLISFPQDGFTLSLDFPMRPDLLPFLDDLDQVVVAYGGRQYLAKDSRMRADHFESMYPNLEAFRSILHEYDPDGLFQSDQSIRLGVRG